MSPKTLMKKIAPAAFAVGLAWLAAAPQAQAQDGRERLHDYEREIDFNWVRGEYPSTFPIVLDLGYNQCLDRIEVQMESVTGAPTVFVLAASKKTRGGEILIQDIHQGTITLPPAARRDPYYKFRFRATVSQVTLMVGGDAGSRARVNAARAIVIPDCRYEE